MGRGPALTPERLVQALADLDKYGSIGAAAKARGISYHSMAGRLAKAREVLNVPGKRKPRSNRKNKVREVEVSTWTAPPPPAEATWQAYIDGGRQDSAMLSRLLERELGWMRKMAFTRSQATSGVVPEDDLFQEGYIGLVKAAQDYTTERGVRFGTYASRRVFGAMQDHMRHLDHVPRMIRRSAKHAAKAAEELRQDLGRDLSDEELCAHLGIGRKQLAAMAIHDMTSTDDILYHNENGVVAVRDMLIAMSDSPESAEALEDFAKKIFRPLPMDDQCMLWLWIVRGATMLSLAGALGLSESRVSQRINAAKKRLMETLSKEAFA